MLSYSSLKKSFSIPIVLLYGIVLSIAFVFHASLAYSNNTSQQKHLIDEAGITLKSFLDDEQMTWFQEHIKDARGIFVVPQMAKGAFYIRGSGGSGVLIVRNKTTNEWTQPAFFILGGADLGIQDGDEPFEVVLLVMSQRVVDTLINTTIQLGTDAAIITGPMGNEVDGSAAPDSSPDFLSFSRINGLLADVSLEGAAVAARDKWNAAYYGNATKASDVFARRNMNNSHSTKLLQIVLEATQPE